MELRLLGIVICLEGMRGIMPNIPRQLCTVKWASQDRFENGVLFLTQDVIRELPQIRAALGENLTHISVGFTQK